MKTVPKITEGYKQMNTNTPIWLQSPSDVSAKEYKDFYQSACNAAYDGPLTHTHFSLGGQIECKSILYIPNTLPFELSKDMFDEDVNTKDFLTSSPPPPPFLNLPREKSRDKVRQLLFLCC